MSFEGVWKVEMLGPYGWENLSTAFLEDGRMLGASANHYSIGRYEANGDTINVSTRITQYGEKRTVFGVQRDVFDVRMEVEVNSTGELAGLAYPADNDNFHVNVRRTRLGDMA